MNNADLISQMLTNNEIKDSLILEKIIAQSDLDVCLQDDDDDESVVLIEIDNSSLKQRRSKRLAELNRKNKHQAKVKKGRNLI